MGKKVLTQAERIAKNKKRLEGYNPVMAARNAMRREFSRRCNQCGEWARSSKKAKVAIDHVEPVVDPEIGFVDMNTYFARMWVGKEGPYPILVLCFGDDK